MSEYEGVIAWDWAVAGFDAVCAFNDVITEGDEIALIHGCWFHRDCRENGRRMRPERSV